MGSICVPLDEMNTTPSVSATRPVGSFFPLMPSRTTGTRSSISMEMRLGRCRDIVTLRMLGIFFSSSRRRSSKSMSARFAPFLSPNCPATTSARTMRPSVIDTCDAKSVITHCSTQRARRRPYAKTTAPMRTRNAADPASARALRPLCFVLSLFSFMVSRALLSRVCARTLRRR